MTKPPDERTLREAALAHLARFATTEAGLLRVLKRRVQRWAARAEADGADAETVADEQRAAAAAAADVVRRLAEAGAVDDRTFAASRAARLSRSGRSRQVIAAHLAARGVHPEIGREAMDGSGIDEFGAAILFARRRRAGPFRSSPPPPGEDAAHDARRADLAALARAGFSRAVALRVLALSAAEAADALDLLRRS